MPKDARIASGWRANAKQTTTRRGVRRVLSGAITSSEDGRVVGWLTHRDVLVAYNTRLRQGVAQAESPARAQPSPRRPMPLRSAHGRDDAPDR